MRTREAGTQPNRCPVCGPIARDVLGRYCPDHAAELLASARALSPLMASRREPPRGTASAA